MYASTSDHAAIKAWALKNKAVPAEITPRKFDDDAAILHFIFGRAKDGSPEIVPITWETFFAQFDILNLTMIFDDSPTFEILHRDRPSIRFPGSGNA